MKFTIIDPKVPVPPPSPVEPELEVFLKPYGGDVALMARKKGSPDPYFICTLSKDGLKSIGCVSPSLGLPLDLGGKVKVI